MSRALCDFMRVDSSVVATIIAGFVFVGLWVMALVSLVRSEGQVQDESGRKNKPRRKKQRSPAPKTKRVLDRAMGGLLFIDEAYYLYRAGDSLDYGQEAIEILLQVMENDRDKLVVILAGYKDRMDEFFTSNPGMSSRIAHHLDFAAYELGELTAIGKLMLDQSRYYLSEDAEESFRQYLTGQMDQQGFANARSVRNELERARLRHAHRLASDLHRNWTRDDLMRLEPADILDGRADLLLERNQS